MKFLFSFILVLSFYSQAQAACGDESTRQINGDEAVTIAYILKNSGLAKKTTSGNVVTWYLAHALCRQTNRGVLPDLMPAYKCTKPSGTGKITSKALWDAMSELGVFPDAGAGHVYHEAKEITCKVNKNGDGGYAVNPRCTIKAAWGDECS